MKMEPKTKTKRLESQRKRITATSTPPKNQTQNQNQPYFPFGSEVEVTSDEEGFRGAWYSATVLQPPFSSSSFSVSSEQEKQQLRKVFVEYKNLLSDENGSALLKEFVDVEFVRPKPPVDANDKVYFEVNDVVDAFYQDGWWCGVVTHVSSKSKYSVFFNSPPDEIEFESSDLRIHKNWVDGKWVLPEKQRMRDLNFSPGTAVEVSIDPDNSCDAWFPASFIKEVANNSFLVEYQSSKEAAFQKLAVDSLHIRPAPPSSSNKAFNLLEKVDALDESRWLSGVVTKILADGRYIVYFKRTKKEKELSHSDLRIHMEWINGKWTYSSQDTLMTSNSEKRSNIGVNGGNKEKSLAPSEVSDTVKNKISLDRISTITFNCDQELQELVNEKANFISTSPSSQRTKQTSANGDTSLSRSSRRLNEEPSSDVQFSYGTCKSKSNQMEGFNPGTSVDLDSPTPGNVVLSKLKQGEGISEPSDPSEIKDFEKQSVSRKRGRPPRMRGLPSVDALGEFAVHTPTNDVLSFVPIVIGLTHNGKMIDSHDQRSSQHLKLNHKKAVENEEKYAEDHGSAVSNGCEKQKQAEVTNLKRKRGRPPKVLFGLGSPKTKEAEYANEEKKDDTPDAEDDTPDVNDDTPYAEDDDERSPSNEVEEHLAIIEHSGTSDSAPDFRIKCLVKINDQSKQLSTSKRQVRKQGKSVMLDLNEPVKSVNFKKAKKQKSTKQVDSQSEDDVDNSRIRAIEVFSNGESRDVDRVVAGTSSNASDDDRPLSAWFDGAHCLPPADSGFSLSEITGPSDEIGERGEEIKTAQVGQLEEKEQEKREYSSVVNGSEVQDKNVRGRPDEMLLQSQSTAIVTVEERELPFVKNSLIWELIENMEVLKRIPQKPHFLPLYNCKEECREGLAIGSMVTFTSLVERISKTRFDDPKSHLDGYLEALVDLEELGFNVAPVREQLNTMVSLKSKFEQAQNTSEEIESQLMERNLEKSTINVELSEVDKKIAELMEKRALVMSKRERKDAEIIMLQTSIDAIKNTLENAEQEFEKVTASLW